MIVMSEQEHAKLTEDEARDLIDQHDASKAFWLVLADRRDPEHTSFRAVAKWRGYLVIYKRFDVEAEEDKESLKFYHNPKLVAKVMTYWNTVEYVEPGSEEHQETQVLASSYLYRLVKRAERPSH